MYKFGVVNTLSFGVIAIIAIGIALLSIEFGWCLGIKVAKRKNIKAGASFYIAVGATMGLLSFILATTFGMAAARFDLRKANVVTEANAIGTTYLRIDFLPDSLREEARQLIRSYTTLRSGGESSIISVDGMAKSANIQDRLWMIGSIAVKQSDTISVGLFIQSLNDMIDMDTTRVTTLRNRLPDNIWLMLTLITIFSMASLGFEFGIQGYRSWIGNILLVIAFTSVILLIADLDRPQQGLVQVSQQPLIDLLNRIGGPLP